MTIQIASSTITELETYVTSTIGSLWAVILLVVSVPLVFYIARKMQHMFPKK